MSDHTTLRLEHPSTQINGNSNVIAYLAPNFKTTPIHDNNVKKYPVPDPEPMRAYDKLTLTDEISVQGVFMHSDNLPTAHQNDLETIFGSLPVTPRQQVNRIREYMHQVGGPYYLYDGSDAYDNETISNVDWSSGQFPTVHIEQFRPPDEAGTERHEYTLKMLIALESA